jgi:hypothetical protein
MSRLQLFTAKRSRRVAPEKYVLADGLVAEHKHQEYLVNKRVLARSAASDEGRRLAKEQSEDVFPSHLVRHSPPHSPSLLELTCVKLEAGGKATYRTAVPEDNEEECDLRRRRIYELNRRMAVHSNRRWLAYLGSRNIQMRLLESILDGAAQEVLRRALRRFLDRMDAMRRDEHIRAEREEAEKRTRDFSRTIAAAANLPEDEPMLRAMPVDRATGDAETRFCPWAQTTSGCPLLRTAGSCPLSHNQLPIAHATWEFRCWAQKSHQGWIAQRQKIG